MKKIITAFMLLSATTFTACNSNSSSSNNNEPVSTSDTSKILSAVKYTCTMDPDVISDTAGHCPKCGMDLVPIKDSTSN